MSLYSGDLDSLLGPLSLLAPLDDLPLPSFNSHIAIELWEDNLGDDEEVELESGGGPGASHGSQGQKKKRSRRPEPATAPGPPGQRFTIRLTYDGQLLASSTACPTGTCLLSDFLDGIFEKISTECKPESYDGDIPTWDIDASCCNDA